MVWRKTGRPETVDWEEPEKVAVNQIMNIKHAVLTSVDRDDLKDGGPLSGQKPSRQLDGEPLHTLETLIPDFQATLQY